LHVSDCFQEIKRAIQSYDDRELCLCVARLADAARRDQRAIEAVIIDLKNAINALPASALRERARCEIRDAVVRLAIRAYYEGVDSVNPQLVER
jgi:hypothetical protein